MGCRTLLKTQRSAGSRIVVLTLSMIVLTGLLVSAASYLRTRSLASSYDHAMETGLRQKGLAYGQTAQGVLSAVRSSSPSALEPLVAEAANDPQGLLSQFSTGTETQNTPLGFEVWVEDTSAPRGYQLLIRHRAPEARTFTAEDSEIRPLVAQTAATGEPATSIDESDRHLHYSFIVQVSAQAKLIVVPTLDASQEFAFINAQHRRVIRDSIIFAAGSIAFVSLVGGALSFLVSRTLTSRNRVEEALREQARRDPLTGALNHGAIVDELRQRASSGGKPQPFAVVMADVDGMKATNDTYGHPVGDSVLRTVARALEVDGVLLGRYGGDEFVAVLPGADRAAAQRYHSDVTELLRAGNVLDPETGAEVPVSATLGVSFFPEDADSVLELIKLSDNAMYAARRARPVISEGGQMPLREDERAARVVGELVPLLVAEGSLSAKLRQIAYRLCTGAGYDAVTIVLYAEEPGHAAVSHTVGRVADEFASAWDRFIGNEGIVTIPFREQLERTRRPLILNDIQTNQQLNPELRELLRKTGMESGVVAPMMWQDRTLGSLGIASRQANAFGPRDAQFLASVATQVIAIVRMSSLVEDLRAMSAQLTRAQQETVLLLAAAAEAHDGATGQHLQRVQALVEMVARELGYPESEAESLGLAAVLHDIGKLFVPETVLTSAGPLDDASWELLKRHTTMGQLFLTGHTGFELASMIACHHHERWDGAGYPEGLAGEQIPEPAAIVCVADAFDAMTSGRPYRHPIPVASAVAELMRCSGTQFSPRVVEAIARLYERGELSSSSRASLQRTAA
jgi:diguanylate cyclase (GGDEF)-like protein